MAKFRVNATQFAQRTDNYSKSRCLPSERRANQKRSKYIRELWRVASIVQLRWQQVRFRKHKHVFTTMSSQSNSTQIHMGLMSFSIPISSSVGTAAPSDFASKYFLTVWKTWNLHSDSAQRIFLVSRKSLHRCILGVMVHAQSWWTSLLQKFLHKLKMLWTKRRAESPPPF